MDIKRYSYFYRNGLTIVFTLLFLITLVAQAVTGWKEHNKDLADENVRTIGFAIYLTTGHFISATFENFQSEFLQMALYVVLTVHFRQLGSAESKKLGQQEEVDRKPKASKTAPWPVKKGGWILKLYSQSLSICFIILFLISWGLHLFGSWKEYNIQQVIKDKAEETLLQYLAEPGFWFETFQNWQSEFLSVASIVFLTIYLRQQGSPESKPVDAPHFQTGK